MVLESTHGTARWRAQVGKTITWQQFTSTSKHQHVARKCGPCRVPLEYPAQHQHVAQVRPALCRPGSRVPLEHPTVPLSREYPCVRACVRRSLPAAAPWAALRFVALLPGSKLSGTIFVLRVKTGDSGVPRVLSAVLHAYCTHYPSAENAGTEYPSTVVRSIHRIISRAHAAAAQHAVADLHPCRLATQHNHGCAGKAIEEFSQFIEEAEVRHGSGQPHPHALPVHTQRSAAATVCLVRMQQSSAAN